MAQQLQGKLCHALGLVAANVVTLLELAHGLFAQIFVDIAPHGVKKHAVAQARFVERHACDDQLFKRRHHHRQPAGKHIHALGFDALELGFFHAARIGNFARQHAHGIQRDALAHAFCGNHGGDGFGAARCAQRAVPALLFVDFADALDFAPRGGNGSLKILLADFVLEEALGIGYAAQRQAFGVGGLQLAAEDEFG